ncbi:MAG: aminotransferase class I/II-fold pyridoxal phosphate-dependent enzyme, partial [Candidatus Thermoplasmatota archaeon]
MEKTLKSRTHNIPEAPIQKLLEEVKPPENTISLGQGAPFFQPPKEAIQAAIKTIKTPEGNRYTPDAGILSLRKQISKKLEKQNKIKADPEKNITVTSGGNQAFLNTIMAITKPGDNIIILTPHYFNHPMAVQLTGCKPITVETTTNYQPNPEKIFEKVNSKTRAIITISPNNPTGAVYSKNVLKKINQYCKENNIYHISDEAYEKFVYNNKKHYSPSSFDTKNEHTITLFSFSKTYGMP